MKTTIVLGVKNYKEIHLIKKSQINWRNPEGLIKITIAIQTIQRSNPNYSDDDTVKILIFGEWQII